ncbi:2-oxoisovalerate dehydrogenase beta subunit, mitochondrial precursor, putative [Trypanosoma brucei brucei TREU927]|uniref:3-methyl-2-oxobutanoate dehydrogenase (2-methylpropanoyl-transferring) n=1 Tax=Trypanosoma brucei brucei (strain 927/4 GUTat10.1) TaxID=185431 RepID=Q4FKP5_TRYB2|nr:2-oxoisovalerate dehydrogenase subunit beta [Trypanosoma brucei brucei TREU927]EAN77853.1 2-oxoisovalerate dehydrogenase beta subunit, mitochondrial precursor, putative [Trypanosoma brucei brucei TREU927]CAJ16754.1 branched-chain alpha-keto acid dehydrogenase e1-beta subunit precursor, putative [Trypanosoma brucei brucei TREU927]
MRRWASYTCFGAITMRLPIPKLAERHMHSPASLTCRKGVPTSTTAAVEMTYFQAINSALDLSLLRDPKTVLFGEDVSFGGVFRCSLGLAKKYGSKRVFDSPLSEQGIVGFAIGMAAVGWKPIAEVQFADYIFPAFDQIVNEAAKMRFRSGGQFSCGGLVVRSPCSAVGHGGLYHSQSVEGYFNHCAGVKIVMPSTPSEAKGLLLQCVEEEDPCIFFEPKLLYRSAVELVEPSYYTIPLGTGRIVREGKDVTIVTYGTQVAVASKAAQRAEKEGISVEVIDLRSLKPWDREMVAQSVRKTGRVIVTHEAPKTSGFGAELISSIVEDCFLSLEAPPKRVCGLDTPHPLHEQLYLPNEAKVYEAVKEVIAF